MGSHERVNALRRYRVALVGYVQALASENHVDAACGSKKCVGPVLDQLVELLTAVSTLSSAGLDCRVLMDAPPVLSVAAEASRRLRDDLRGEFTVDPGPRHLLSPCSLY